MFFGNLKQLCDKKSISVTALLNNLGISKGAIKRWKEGGHPNSTTLQKIADYFGVTADYLLTGTNNKKSSEVNPEDEYQFALLDGAKELTTEGKKELVGYLEYLKSKYKK